MTPIVKREDEGRGIAAFALRHGKAIGLLAVGLCVWGFASLWRAPRPAGR